MGNKQDLEQQISAGLSELKSLLSKCSTRSVAGFCFAYLIGLTRDADSASRLLSPAKQIPFLLSVLMSEQEPDDPVEFDQVMWRRAKSILDQLFSAYLLLYTPSDSEKAELGAEWYRTREISMLAFLHFFNTGILASTEQIAKRINIYLAPFDAQIGSTFGLNASQMLAICHWMLNKLQDCADKLHDNQRLEKHHRRALLEVADEKNWSLEQIREAAQKEPYITYLNGTLEGLDRLGTVSLRELEDAFPDTGRLFAKQFSVGRGDGSTIRYPTEQGVLELRPLIQLNEYKVFCPSINSLFNAVLLICEKELSQSELRAKFFRARDISLEREILETIRPFFNRNAKILANVYETPNGQFEHEIVVVDDKLCVVLEAKATPPVEPFRDPEKAFVRIRDAFRADTGIQKAYDQANRIIRRIRAGEVVPLYDEKGALLYEIRPNKLNATFAVCVTRDNYGPLATNLSLLLRKDTTDDYPWAVNVIDLSTLAETWKYLKWGPSKFEKYLAQRTQLHGKVLSDDELDYSGYFIQHGGFETILKTNADHVQLNPDYAHIFDEIYRHLHLNGPPVIVKTTSPVLMDLRQSLITGDPTFIDLPHGKKSKKIGRNKPCSCGSGRKFKKCCGAKSNH